MKYTDKLKLPIYDTPASDLFTVDGVNTAHQSIEEQYVQVTDIRQEIIDKLANGEFVGEQGDKGDKGDKGEQGDKGDKGDIGETGIYMSTDIINVPIQNGVLNLTTDLLQKTVMADMTEIVLPTTDRNLEIHLFFEATSSFTLILPNCTWQYTPEITSGNSYEIIFTKVNNKWLGGVIEYGE